MLTQSIDKHEVLHWKDCFLEDDVAHDNYLASVVQLAMMGVVVLAGGAKVDSSASLAAQLGLGVVMIESKGTAAKHT